MRYPLIYPFILIIIMAGCHSNPTHNPHERFRGLWKLYRIDARDTAGSWSEYHWNKGGDSYILYDGLGHMAVHFTPLNYRDRKTKSPRTPVDSLNLMELRTDLSTYMSSYAYTAKCTILEEVNIIEHQRLSHTYPAEWGATVQRRYAFRGDTLILWPIEPENPLRLKWIKQP